MGRPSKYTQAIADEICERLAQGESLRAICRDEHMPPEVTVRRWVVQDVNGIAAQYTRARDMGLDTTAEECREIADEGSGDVARDRLRFDERRWYLSKLAPKRYGDKQQVEHSGSVGITQLLDAAEQARKPPVDTD